MTTFDPEKITLFARTNARGQNVPFGIKAKDRQKHMYVIGKTGMGKSTLLENMAAQDIQNGEGLAFLDPHGSAIETLLDYVPEHRLDDVVYFAPFDMENPVSFNIMEDVGADTRHLVVSGLMSTFKKIWEDAWSARMEYILTNALLALIEYPDTTLLSVNRMLADKTYRDKVVDAIQDPAVKAYWLDEFANYTERFAAEALPAIQNKIGQFTGNPLIRNIIGQPKSSFDIRKMMDEKKILLVNLSKGLVGETNADLLGSMLTTKIYLAAMSRAELPPAQMAKMPNFYFYVDEFQSFSNSTFANILSEARKYHLNLIIAHQYVEQMEEMVKNAVFGNVGTTISFRVGPFDAEVLEPIFAPQFTANDLVNLGFTQIYLTLMIDGVGSQPFSASTLPPVEAPPKSHKFMVIKRSQENYSRPRAEAEQIVTDLHTPEERVEATEQGEGGNKGGFTKPSAFFKVGTDREFVKQKERLKNGGSRLKGPAQTPPGTKSHAPQNNKNGNNNNSRSQKSPAGSQKSPEDLKAILAQMAGKDSAANKSENGEARKQSTKPNKSADKPAVGDTEHKANLKAALAGVLEQAPKAEATALTEPKPAPKPKETPPKEAAAKPAKPTTQSDAVIASLKQQFNKTEPGTAKSNKTDAKSRVDNELIKPATPSPQADAKKDDLLKQVMTKPEPEPAQQPAANRIRKVVIERRPQVSIQVPDQAPAEPEESAAAPGLAGTARPRPAFAAATEPDGPDVKTVKKMLRHNTNERLPGMR